MLWHYFHENKAPLKIIDLFSFLLFHHFNCNYTSLYLYIYIYFYITESSLTLMKITNKLKIKISGAINNLGGQLFNCHRIFFFFFHLNVQKYNQLFCKIYAKYMNFKWKFFYFFHWIYDLDMFSWNVSYKVSLH